MKNAVRLAMAIITIAVALTVAQPAFGIPHQLIFTEDSSMSLVVTYDGAPIPVSEFVPFHGDHWLFFPEQVIDFVSGMYSWNEPDGNGVNAVFVSPLDAFVLSDYGSGGGGALDGTFVPIGIDRADNGRVFAAFYDHADDRAVPETGSTFTLLTLSFLALMVMRLTCLQTDDGRGGENSSAQNNPDRA